MQVTFASGGFPPRVQKINQVLSKRFLPSLLKSHGNEKEGEIHERQNRAPLAPKMVAWVWFAVAAGFSLMCGWKAMQGQIDWTMSAVSAGIALLIYLEPRLRRREVETVQVDDVGILRVDGSIREEVRWEAIAEIKIITTNTGPYGEDVFFVLTGAGGKGCLVPHAAAVRTKLLEALQARFPIDDAAVIAAMGCTSNNSFLLWKRAVAGHASVTPDG
ncbi:MAG TPA: hypothetical protein VN325_02450 [Steroidobacteraceae bacterium]|nr:hypothetical protein [Steroidobacteraceae bacterium]